MIATFINSFILFFVTIDTIGNLPFFLSLTEGAKIKKRNQIALKSIIIAFFIMVAFAYFGRYLLEAIHVSLDSLKIAGGVILMFGAIFILFVLPWLDTSKVRSAVFRPIYRQFYWIFVLDVLMLGYMGAMPAEGIYLVLARVGTIYYFLHFIVVLPVVGLLEKTDPIPMSISEPVLTGGADPSLARKDNEKI